MAVRCSKCGEELLGPVNRCWKCGQQFTVQAEEGGLPPVRYAPVNLPPDVVQAQFADPGVVTATVPGEESIAAAAPPPVASPGPMGNHVRTGSPFVKGAAMQAATTAAFPRNPLVLGVSSRIPGPPAHDPLAVAGAITAILMGVFALGIAWIANWVAISAAAVIALIGFALGIWGLHSKRRGWSLLGILLCCAAIGLSTYTGVLVVYQARQERQENQADPDFLP
jgi:hypothetical protein